MTNQDKQPANAELLENVSRYEKMLVAGNRVYFDEEDLLDVADYYYNEMSRNEDALRCLGYLLQLHPKCLQAELLKAEITFFEVSHEEGWAQLWNIKETDDPDVLYYYGLFNLKDEKLVEAETYYHKAFFAVKENEIDMFCQIVWDYLEDKRRFDFNKWLSLLPEKLRNDTRVLEAQAEYCMQQGSDAAGIRIIQTLLDRDPYNAAYWYSLANVYYKKNKYSKAQESVAYALDINQDNTDALLLAAEISASLRNDDEALKYYKKYISLDDKNWWPYFKAAEILYNRNQDLDVALRYYHYALKYVPDYMKASISVLIYDCCSTIYSLKDDASKAVEYLDKAKAAGLGEASYYNRRFVVWLQSDNDEKVIEDFDKILKLNSSEGFSPVFLLSEIIKHKKYGVATLALQHLEAAHPESFADYIPLKSILNFLNKDYDEFFINLQKAANLNPQVTRDKFMYLLGFPANLSVAEYADYAKRLIDEDNKGERTN